MGVGMLALAGWSAAQAPAAEMPLDKAEVRSWLLRIHDAAQTRNFQGIFVVTTAGQMSSARIAHYAEGSDQYERIETLDGQARSVLRHNDVVATLWPDSRAALIERREASNSFPRLIDHDGDRIVEHYDVRRKGVDRVAGHEAHLLLLTPRDAMRYGYRLWSEKVSGLLLRADVLNAAGEVIESSAFSEVSIGVKPQPDTVTRPLKRLKGYRVERPVMTPTYYENEGWTYQRVVPGFRHVSCVKRSHNAVDGAQVTENADRSMLQTIFSDGLAHVSIFVEPFDAARHRREVVMSMGATHTLMKRHGAWWVTAVGEVPAATLHEFVRGLERKKPQ
ncbi:transcriptional regulator [Caldimonas caldifontis]|uniref:Transcriptional regulator n=2 Tax=Caldimonas caldifontis TaxID=1452508 RepID=A0A2S5SZN2_9BURK|nr:transcriptional regulator [Caldimonas caldifontis]